MTTDNRTLAEKQRDAQGDPRPQVTRVSVKELMARKRAMEQKPVSLDSGTPIVPAADGPPGPGYPGYVPRVWVQESIDGRDVTNADSQPRPAIPQATPASLVDQAANVARQLSRLADGLEGAADWCEARAKEYDGLERHALEHAARIMRSDAKRCTPEAPEMTEEEPCPGD